MFKKLSVKLASGIIIALTVITIVFVPMYVHTQKNAYIANEIRTMEEFYEEFIRVSFSSDIQALDEHMEESDTRNYTVFICDEQLYSVYSTSGTRRNVWEYQKKIINNTKLFSEDAKPQHIENTKNDTEQILLRKIENQDNKKYYVYISENLDATNSVLAYTNKNIVIIIVCYIVVCALVLILLVNNRVKSVKKLSYVTEKISQEDYSVRYDGKITNDEIGILSKNINQMADTIQENINSLSNYNFLLKEDLNYMAEYDRIRKSVISNITHELKTPLAIISSQVEMMNCSSDSKKKAFYYDSAMEEIGKMSKLISRLLNYSVVENEIFEDEIKTVDLSDVIRQLSEKQRNYILSKNLILYTEIEDGCVLNIEPRHIEHVFNNFLSNAITNSKQGAEIKIRLRRMGNKFRFSVFNEGENIKTEYKDKIWTNFFTTNKRPENNESVHAGLGLFIVKEISTIDHTDCGFVNCSNGVEFWFDFIGK